MYSQKLKTQKGFKRRNIVSGRRLCLPRRTHHIFSQTMHLIAVIMTALLVVVMVDSLSVIKTATITFPTFSKAKEVLPAIAYFNRTLYPPLVIYRHGGEHLRVTQKIQHLRNELDYQNSLVSGYSDDKLIQNKKIKPDYDRIKLLESEVKRWETLRAKDLHEANREVENEAKRERRSETNGGVRDGDDADAHLLPLRPLLSMAIVSDIQYAPKEEEKRRHFKISKLKLQHAVKEIIINRSQHLDLLMNLGDTVDDNIAEVFPEVLPVFEQLSLPSIASKSSSLSNSDSQQQSNKNGNNRNRNNHDDGESSKVSQCAERLEKTLLAVKEGSEAPGVVGGGPEAPAPAVDASPSTRQFEQHYFQKAVRRHCQTPIKVRHMLGNHDFLNTNSKDFDTIHTILKMPSRYYALDAVSDKSKISKTTTESQKQQNAAGDGKNTLRTFRLIVLDGNDLSIYGTDVNSEKRKQAEAMLGILKRRRAKNAQMFNGALSSPQIEWLKQQLEDACATGKIVFIFIHHPMRPKNEPTNLWNDVEVVPIIASYGCVAAVINGHAHRFLYDFQHTRHRDVHFITFGGMVQSPFTSWGFIDVFEDKLRVYGLVFGRPIDFWYDISDKSLKYHNGGGGGSSVIDGGHSGNQVDNNNKPTTIFVSSAPEHGKGLRFRDRIEQQQQEEMTRQQKQQLQQNGNAEQLVTMNAALDEIAKENGMNNRRKTRRASIDSGGSGSEKEDDIVIDSSSSSSASSSLDSSFYSPFSSSSSSLQFGDVITVIGIFICLIAMIVMVCSIRRGGGGSSGSSDGRIGNGGSGGNGVSRTLSRMCNLFRALLFSISKK